jgi:hypothetical protein
VTLGQRLAYPLVVIACLAVLVGEVVLRLARGKR